MIDNEEDDEKIMEGERKKANKVIRLKSRASEFSEKVRQAV